MNTEFAIGKLAGFFSHIVRIWALQKCCFWIHPSQWEPTKPTATTHILIQLLPPFYLTPWPDLRQGGHSLCCVKLWCGQGERWACGVSLCHTQFRCWAVGIADSWGFQVIAEVFWNWSLALSAVLLGLQDLLSVHDCAAVLCLVGFLLSQELHGSERNCVPPHHSQRGSPASCTWTLKAQQYWSES